MDRPTFHLVNY